ncbi:MAG: magnesium transporter [Candidatus Thiodiazotropha sp.]|jgi:magnesium transporter
MQDESLLSSEGTEQPLPLDDRLRQLIEALQPGKAGSEFDFLMLWTDGEIAATLEALPLPERQRAWERVPEERRGSVLACMSEPARAGLLKRLDVEEVVTATSDLKPSDLVLVVEQASDELQSAILESLAPADRSQMEQTLSYPEDSAGRLMQREWVAVRADVTLETVKRYLHFRSELPNHTTALMVVDREGKYRGKLSLEQLLLKDDQHLVAQLMDSSAIAVNTHTSLTEVAGLFQRRDIVSLPVVDDAGLLVGRIVFDDVIPLIRSEAEQPMLHMAGLQADEDLLAPIASSARRRLFWLGINLLTAFLAAWVIGLFEATLDQIVALAVLMPIVASMGGIAGSQTLTLAIRGLALGQITASNTRWLAYKEILIAIISGIIWALVVGTVAYFWFGRWGISLILGAAMVINLLTAALSGLVIPLLLQRIGQDPALSGSVILTTITDVVGFMSFLGLATWLLL